MMIKTASPLTTRVRCLSTSVLVCLGLAACQSSGTNQGQEPKEDVATSQGGNEGDVDATSAASQYPEEEIPDGPRKLGVSCKVNSDCASQLCAEVIIPREEGDLKTMRCSECSDDTVCKEKDEATYCMVDRKMRANVCADGSDGDSCKSDDQCKSKLCTKVNLGDNTTTIFACSRCKSHADCDQDSENPNCISRPEENWKPYNQCLPDGVRKDGEVCFPCESGDRECKGKCVAVETPGDFCMGVCGECAIDSDCAEGFVCQAPKLLPGESGMHQGSVCVKKGG